MRSLTGSLIFMAIMLAVDLYVFQGIKAVTNSAGNRTRLIASLVFWILSIVVLAFMAALPHLAFDKWQKPVRTYVFAVFIGLFVAKLVAVPFLLIDDFRRIFQWSFNRFFSPSTPTGLSSGATTDLSRSAFLSWIGLGIGGTLFGTLVFGFKNQYNYKVKKIKLSFENLPNAFKGFKVIHISDIHSGSLMDKTAVMHGVDLINQQQADLILFTGDLVNDKSEEMEGFKDVFSRLKAPMGVFSTLGNHDYGDYVAWPDRDAAHLSREAELGRRLMTPMQVNNLNQLMDVHKGMGWRLLNDEFVTIEKEGDKIALIGVQNISGKIRFHTYGNMEKAYKGTEAHPFKILMSHDPSHWDKEVKEKYADIDLMLSGHTHGMQFGVELPGFKWSPVKWVYKQWAGLYEHGKQKLYVNPGFGFIGYPGRVGILPEITLIELV